MNAKTIRLASYATLDDTDLGTVQAGFGYALALLNEGAEASNREILWGTLEVEIDNRQIEDVRLTGNVTRINSNNRVFVSALAVLK